MGGFLMYLVIYLSLSIDLLYRPGDLPQVGSGLLERPDVEDFIDLAFLLLTLHSLQTSTIKESTRIYVL